jgi:hypothetical protein
MGNGHRLVQLFTDTGADDRLAEDQARRIVHGVLVRFS